MRALQSGLMLALFAACSAEKPHSELVLVADTDLPLDRIVFALRDTQGKMREVEAEVSAGLPATLSVVEKHDPGVLHVSARGYSGTTLRVEREADVQFVHDETRVVLLHLLAACEGVSCATSESCGEQGCAPRARSAGDLPAWTGKAPRLDELAEPDAGPGDAGFTGPDPVPPMPGPGKADAAMPRPMPGACMPPCTLNDDVKHADPACIDGACGFACKTGFGDCNGDPADGCELELDDVEACGACDHVCLATEDCNQYTCVPD